MPREIPTSVFARASADTHDHTYILNVHMHTIDASIRAILVYLLRLLQKHNRFQLYKYVSVQDDKC